VDWADLERHLAVIEHYRRDPEPERAYPEPASQFTALACLNYTTDGPPRWAAARQLLVEKPDLAEASIWAAASAADDAAVARHLAADSTLASRIGGAYDWEPLMYLTYSRIPAQESAVLATADALLAAGADPNAGYLWHGLTSPFTALTGAFGEGEQGHGRCPPHQHSIALARRLLTAGAEANDPQTLYNRMFSPGNEHLHLLFEYGLGTGTGGPWAARLGGAMETFTDMFDRQRIWAVEHGYADRLSLFHEHGVDIAAATADGRRPIDVAAANGDRASVALLSAAGANPPELAGPAALTAAILAGDRAETQRWYEFLPAVRVDQPDLIWRAVDCGRTAALPLLIELGFDVNAVGDHRGETALHWAAWHGNTEVISQLLAAGADPNRRDASYDATPLGWAEHAYNEPAIAQLAPVTAG